MTLVYTKTLPVSNTAVENFLEFYENELNLLAEDLCEKFSNSSEILLKTKEMQETLTQELKDLKIFLQEFLRDYPHIKRYRNFQPLLILITNTANTNYTNDNENYAEMGLKFKETFRYYFKDILKDYAKNYETFVQKKVLPKIENSHKQLQPENKNHLPKFLQMIENFKTCKEFECFPTYMDELILRLNFTKELIMKYTINDYKHFLNIVYIKAYNRSKVLLKDDKLKQLSEEVKHNLTQDLNDFIQTFENNTDTEEFVLKAKEKLNLHKKYYRNTNFLPNDQELLNEFFKKPKINWNDISKYDLALNDVMESLSITMVLFLVSVPDEIPEKYKPLLEYRVF